MMRLIAMTVVVAGLASTGASAYPSPTNSDAQRQQCQTQTCRDCVDQCDRALDQRMADCAAQYPRPGDTQQMCFYWATADHNMCLDYECGL